MRMFARWLPMAAVGANPCTGDAFPLYTWLVLMGVALIALIAAVIFFWKSTKK